MKIKLEYGIKSGNINKDTGKEYTPQELTYDYVSYAVNKKYPEMEGQIRRIWGRIQNKFDKAIEANDEEIELDETQSDFVKKCFREAKFNPSLAKYINVLEDEIDKL